MICMFIKNGHIAMYIWKHIGVFMPFCTAFFAWKRHKCYIAGIREKECAMVRVNDMVKL